MTELTITRKDGIYFTVKVDDCDAHLLDDHKWTAFRSGGNWYVHRTVMKNYVSRSISLHRAIMCPADGLVVDHINGDTLDNRRSNLRIATIAQNLRNKKTPSSNTSGYKGVVDTKCKLRKRRFKAQVKFEGKRHHIGYYLTAEEAAHAYNIKAAELFGEFARPNVL
jgi:hypothetical protein